MAWILRFPQGSFTALVGRERLRQDPRLAAILMGRNKGYTGVGQHRTACDLRDIREEGLCCAMITYVSHQSYLFKGTVRDQPAHGQACRDR